MLAMVYECKDGKNNETPSTKNGEKTFHIIIFCVAASFGFMAGSSTQTKIEENQIKIKKVLNENGKSGDTVRILNVKQLS